MLKKEDERIKLLGIHDAAVAIGAAKRFFRASAAWRSFSRFSADGFAVLFVVGFERVFAWALVFALLLALAFVILSALFPGSVLLPSPRFRPAPVLLPSLGPPLPRCPLLSLRPRLLSDRPPPSSAPRPRFVPRSGRARSNAAMMLSPSTVPNFFARSSAFCRSASAAPSPSGPLVPVLAVPKRAARAARLASSALKSVDGRFDVNVSVAAAGADVEAGLGLDGEAGVVFGAGAETVRSWVLAGSMAAT